MTAIFRPSGILVLLLLACAGIALLALIGPTLAKIAGTIDLEAPPVVDAPPLTLGELAGLPLTQHAASDHPERGMNAEAIRQAMLSGRCSPVEMWVCEAELVLLCAATESKTPGLKLNCLSGDLSDKLSPAIRRPALRRRDAAGRYCYHSWREIWIIN